MVSVQSPPGRRELPYARVLLLLAILMAAATGAAVALVATQARLAVGVCGAVATVLVIAAGAESVRRGRRLRELRAERDQRVAYLERRVAYHAEENRRLAQQFVPNAVEWLRAGNSPREVMRDFSEGDPDFRELDDAQRAVIRKILDIVDHEESLRDSAQRSFVSIARRVQAIVHQQSAELREMEEDHGRNPEVFDDLLRIDHGTSLIGRLADSIGVLGGGLPGRNWPQPVPLYSVLRGAMSRILEYRRIQLDSIAKVNIRGLSVEPLIHALAELLDNATRYSPPQSKVHVNAVEVQTGIAIEIEDAGCQPQRRGPRQGRTHAGAGQGGRRHPGRGRHPAPGPRGRRPSVHVVQPSGLAAHLGLRRRPGRPHRAERDADLRPRPRLRARHRSHRRTADRPEPDR